jgi:hypothetical protein
MECIPVQQAWNAFLCVWSEWEAPNRLYITWPFVLLGEAVFKDENDPPDLHHYHMGSFTCRRQSLDIFRSFLLHYL